MTLPWAQHYDPGVPLTVGPVKEPLPRLLLNAAAKTPQAPALIFFGRIFTYQQLAEQAARLAGAFKGQGLAKGERLAILLPNCPQFVVAYHAALRLGAVVVPLNPLLSGKEVAINWPIAAPGAWSSWTTSCPRWSRARQSWT